MRRQGYECLQQQTAVFAPSSIDSLFKSPQTQCSVNRDCASSGKTSEELLVKDSGSQFLLRELMSKLSVSNSLLDNNFNSSGCDDAFHPNMPIEYSPSRIQANPSAVNILKQEKATKKPSPSFPAYYLGPTTPEEPDISNGQSIITPSHYLKNNEKQPLGPRLRMKPPAPVTAFESNSISFDYNTAPRCERLPSPPSD